MVKFGKERSCNHFDIFTQRFFKKRITIASANNMSLLVAEDLFALEISKVDSEMIFSIGMKLERNNIHLNVGDLHVFVAEEREFVTKKWLQDNSEILLKIEKNGLFPLLILGNFIIYYTKDLQRIDEVVLLLDQILNSVQIISKEHVQHENAELPEKFRPLQKWIDEWAISDDNDREILLDSCDREELVRFVQSVWYFLPEINLFLDSESNNDSNITNILSALAETVCEAQIRVNAM